MYLGLIEIQYIEVVFPHAHEPADVSSLNPVSPFEGRSLESGGDDFGHVMGKGHAASVLYGHGFKGWLLSVHLFFHD
jgi:hypothetical protein